MPFNRLPTPPGEFLQEFLDDFGISQSELARRIHQRRAMTPSTALRLSRFFGNSPEFWMNAQLACDLYEVSRREEQTLGEILPVG